MKFTQCCLIRGLKEIGYSDTESVLRAANFILHDEKKLLEVAVEVLDERPQPIRKVQSSCGRHFWLVAGSRGHTYVCLENFCHCRSFSEVLLSPQVVPGRPDQLPDEMKCDVPMCKHLLAVQLAEAIDGFVLVQVFW